MLFSFLWNSISGASTACCKSMINDNFKANLSFMSFIFRQLLEIRLPPTITNSFNPLETIGLGKPSQRGERGGGSMVIWTMLKIHFWCRMASLRDASAPKFGWKLQTTLASKQTVSLNTVVAKTESCFEDLRFKKRVFTTNDKRQKCVHVQCSLW